MTIYHIPRKSNVVTNALLHSLEVSAVDGSVDSGLLSQNREAQAVAFGDLWKQLKKVGSVCKRGFMFHDGLLCRTQGGSEVSLVIPEDAGLQTDLLWQFHDASCGGYLGVYHIIGALSK